MTEETPWVQRYLDAGWEWRRKPKGTAHLCLYGRTLCGRSSDGLRSVAMDRWGGCLSCRDIAGGIIFDRNHGVAS